MMLQRLLSSLVLLGGLANAATQPNILFILTDDQDYHMDSVEHMASLNSLIAAKGVTHTRHYCTVSLCCPSRATIWTGRSAHNHNVTSVKPPYGGYAKVVSQGVNDDYLPIWMQNAGYNTYYAGKLWNAYGLKSYPNNPAKGWTGSDILVDPHTYRYWAAAMSRDGGQPVSYKGQYSTDVVASKASAYLDEALKGDKPWMVVAAPVAPHAQVNHKPVKHPVPPPCAPRHRGLFKDFSIPRTPNFNPDEPSGVGFIAKLPQLNPKQVANMDEWQRARMRALQSVDEMIEDLVKKVEDAGVADNTYIIFSTDNGFHIGQHRQLPGKKCAFEEDINVPLMIRGPGIPEGVQTDAVSSHTDLAPTFMQIAGQSLRDDFDGEPIPLTPDDFNRQEQKTEHTEVEFWGATAVKGLGPQPNTYKAVRLIGPNYNLLYTVWCTNEKEFYDMNTDPYQMNNLFSGDSSSYKLFNQNFKQVVNRLDALTMVLKSCKADECRLPWKSIHPDGQVKNLEDALHPDFDELYDVQPRVSFSKCALGYIPEYEGPQKVYPQGSEILKHHEHPHSEHHGSKGNGGGGHDDPGHDGEGHDGKHHDGKHHDGKHHDGKHHDGKDHPGKHHDGKGHDGQGHGGKDHGPGDQIAHDDLDLKKRWPDLNPADHHLLIDDFEDDSAHSDWEFLPDDDPETNYDDDDEDWSLWDGA